MAGPINVMLLNVAEACITLFRNVDSGKSHLLHSSLISHVISCNLDNHFQNQNSDDNLADKVRL